VDQKKTASARVTVTVEIDVGSSWGDDCSVGQVHDSASREALGKLRHLIETDGHALRQMRIIGAPKVVAIIATREQ
jgi:hypothetical protein